MDFRRKKVKIIPEVNLKLEDLEKMYPHNVSLYSVPPIQDVSLESFEDMAVERLKVLRVLDQVNSKNIRYLSDEWKASIITELKSLNLKDYVRLIKGGSGVSHEADLMARERDYISHFILRLVYCRNDDLKRWFISKELDLFRLKFRALSTPEIKTFLELNNLEYKPISADEKNEVKEGLAIGQNSAHIEMLDYYKVSFLECLDLVRNRKCYLKNGFAYISAHDFVSIIASKQQQLIENGLESAQKMLPELENDERISGLIKGLHTSYTGKDYTLSDDTVPPESIDQLSKKSFPLCMRSCHEHLRAKHHLKHFSRLQFGLFLKGIGVTLEDSLRFFREEFTKMMDVEKFEKSYRYGIRYNYGKEGSMNNFNPYSCSKIIATAVGPQDSHGCPFKQLESQGLRAKLSSDGIATAHQQDIVSYASKGHFQLACAKYFEIVHETTLDEGINHPNQYFELSQKLMGARKPATAANKPIDYKSNVKLLEKKLMGTQLEDSELWDTTEEGESFKQLKDLETEWENKVL